MADQYPTDAELIRQYAQTRSEEAFERLAGRYVDLVYSAALRQVRDAHLAEDVAQAVFILLSQQSDRMDERTILSVWLYRATYFASRNALKVEARRRHHEMSLNRPAHTEPEPSERWSDVAPLLDEAMQSLGRTDRAALLLRYFQGRSVQDVGVALGLSENAATKRIGRAIEKLRRYFARRGVEVGAVALAAGLAAHAIQAAPAGLATVVTGATIGAEAGTAGATIAQAAALTMAGPNITGIAVAAVIGLGVLGVSLAVLRGMDEAKDKPIPQAVAQRSPATAPVPTTTRPPQAVAALPAEQPGPVTGTPGVPPLGGGMWIISRDAFSIIEAESYDTGQGIRKSGRVLTSIDPGDCVRYQSVDFKDGPSFLHARIGCKLESEGRRIQVRLGSLTGPLVAELTVRSTGAFDNYVVQSAPVSGARGIHDVYLTFAGEGAVGELDWICFGRGEVAP